MDWTAIVLAKRIGETLTLETAKAISKEIAHGPVQVGCCPEDARLLEKWRHLIEPVIAQSATPMPWEGVLKSRLQIYEGCNSVLVCKTSARVITVWVAAGELQEVLTLFSSIERMAAASGIRRIDYLGRRGWVRSAGFREISVFGTKEIPPWVE